MHRLLLRLFLAAALPAGLAATALEPVPLGRVQGRVGDDSDPFALKSPMLGQTVEVRVVVHQVQTWTTRKGEERMGLFAQDPPALADDDERTSDGVFVYIEDVAGFGDAPVAGDFLRLRAEVDDYYGQVELVRPAILKRLGRPHALAPFVANPPSDRAAAARYWRARAGMLVVVPKGSVVQGPPVTEYWSGDNLFYCVSARHPLGRTGRRVFRDAHPLDDVPGELFDNGNGFLIGVSSRALPGEFPALRTFDRLAALRGAVRLHQGEFKVVASAMPEWRRPRSFQRTEIGPPKAGTLTIATFNVENLYDLRDDPTDDCDAPDDPGCPDVRKPFNYLPEDEAAYEAKLQALARQLVEDLHGPDLLLVQEAEDQDIVAPEGANDPLSDLAARVRALGGPADYAVANDRDGADDRGIVCAFLYRTNVLRLAEAEADDPVFGEAPAFELGFKPMPLNTDVSNPKCFNGLFVDPEIRPPGESPVFSRAVQVARFEVGGRTLHVLNNHFSSRPDRKVLKRRSQAAIVAAVVEAIQAGDPDAWIVAGGDLNTFPRPDEPLPNKPGDQLGPIYRTGLVNLYDRVLARAPGNAYSYIYKGQSGTLDHLFVSGNLAERVTGAAFAHLNADFPGSPTDHDPIVLRLRR